VKEDQKNNRRARGSHGGRPPTFDATRYGERNTVERCFNKLKQFRAVATRFDKRKLIYQGTLDVASIRIWLRDLDTGLVPRVGIPAANAPEAAVTEDIAADLDAAGRRLSELHIDRAYLSSALVRDRSPDLAVFCRAWRVRNTGGRFAKDQFTLDFAAGQLTCPAGVTMPFQPGKTVRFPKSICAACPLRARCTTRSHGPSVSVHPDQALLAEPRQRQQTPQGRAKLRERVAVEHALAHVGHWQGRRARYLGTRKNLFDLRRVAVVHNLHIIARQPITDGYQLAA